MKNANTPASFNTAAGKTQISTILKPSRSRYKKKTFIRIFSLTVVVSLVVLIFALLTFYTTFSNSVTKEVHSKSIRLLKQTELAFNLLHSWIIPSFHQMQSDPAISQLVFSDTVEKTTISKGLDSLERVSTSFHPLHSIYIYNNRTQEYYSTINGYEAETCSDYTLSAIVHNIPEFSVYDYIPRKIVYRESGNIFNAGRDEVKTQNVFSIVIGNKPAEGNTINGAIIVNISEERIRENLLDADSNEGTDLIIIDNKGKIITHPDSELFDSYLTNANYVQRILNSESTESVFAEMIDGKKYLVSYITNQAWQWHFVTLTDYQNIFADLDNFLRTAIIICILLMAMAILLALFGSLRIYSPIQRLLSYSLKYREKYSSGELSTEKSQLGELQALDRIFRKVVEQAEDDATRLEDYKAFHSRKILKELLNGELDAERLEKFGDFIHTLIGNGPYFVTIIKLDGYKKLLETLNIEEIMKLFTIIEGLLQHYLPFSHKFVQIKDDTACLICSLTEGETNRSNTNPSEIISIFESAKTRISAQLHHTITVCISDIVDSLEDVRNKYRLSLDACNYRFRLGESSIIHTGLIPSIPEELYLVPEEDIKEIFIELKRGNIEKKNSLILEIFENVKRYKYEDFLYLIQFLNYKIRKEIVSYQDKLGPIYQEIIDSLTEIEMLETVDQISAKYFDIFTEIAETLNEKQSKKANNLAIEVRKYIDQHYTEQNFYSESIAEFMGYSTHYIRTTFKQTFGMSIIDYTNDLRLDFCKKQLEETKLPIKRVFKLAGYYNYSYFFTLFKKKTGITPNQYRFQHKQHKP